MPNSTTYPLSDATPSNVRYLEDARATCSVLTNVDVVRTILGTLGASAYGVYALLDTYCNIHGVASPSVERIAREVNLSDRQVTRILHKLVAAKWIESKPIYNRFGWQTGTEYTLSHHTKPRTNRGDIPSDTGGDTGGDIPSPDVSPKVSPEVREENGTGPETNPLHVAVRSALAEAFGVQSFTKKSLALYDSVTRELVAAGCSPGDVPSLMFWAGKHEFWGKGFGITQLATVHQQWTTAGQPRQKRSVFTYRPWEAQA